MNCHIVHVDKCRTHREGSWECGCWGFLGAAGRSDSGCSVPRVHSSNVYLQGQAEGWRWVVHTFLSFFRALSSSSSLVLQAGEFQQLLATSWLTVNRDWSRPFSDLQGDFWLCDLLSLLLSPLANYVLVCVLWSVFYMYSYDTCCFTCIFAWGKIHSKIVLVRWDICVAGSTFACCVTIMPLSFPNIC